LFKASDVSRAFALSLSLLQLATQKRIRQSGGAQEEEAGKTGVLGGALEYGLSGLFALCARRRRNGRFRVSTALFSAHWPVQSIVEPL